MSDLDQHLAAIAAGDSDAFARWMSGAEAVLRQGLRSFATSVDTEAVLQETLLRLWQVAPRVERDGKPNSLLRLGIRIAKNLAISETRRLKTAATADLSIDTLPSEPVDVPDPILRSKILECKEGLPPKPAQVFFARVTAAGELHDATLAAELGMTKNTFLQNFTRARKFLIECLKQKGIDIHQELA